jgi:hypothetical protein
MTPRRLKIGIGHTIKFSLAFLTVTLVRGAPLTAEFATTNRNVRMGLKAAQVFATARTRLCALEHNRDQ